MPHPQKVARIWFPKYTDHTTPTHQDYVHFQGSYNNLTCWTPVGDCPIELGGLAVIPGSHKVNRVLEHHFSLGAGALVVDETAHDDIDPVWHTTNYEIGDTLIFPALTVHKALPNYTEDKLRLSLDNRYQAVGDTIAEHMLEPHGPTGLDWESVYKNWKTDELKYYWRNYKNPVVPRDMSFADKGFSEALSLARSGNDHAVFRLKHAVRMIPIRPMPKMPEKCSEIGAFLDKNPIYRKPNVLSISLRSKIISCTTGVYFSLFANISKINGNFSFDLRNYMRRPPQR